MVLSKADDVDPAYEMNKAEAGDLLFQNNTDPLQYEFQLLFIFLE